MLPVLSAGTKGETDFGQFVLHAIQEIEGTRQAVVADARKLADLR